MKDFKAYYIIPAEPELVWNALTREATIMLWTGARADLKPEVGYEFSMWDDDIVGKILEIDPGKKLVQEWYFGEDSESIVTLILHDHKKGTSIEVRHSGIPEEHFENITEGWEEVYMGSLQDFFGEEED